MRHADWLSAKRRLSRMSHKYPALVMTVESSSFTPALRVSLTSVSAFVGRRNGKIRRVCVIHWAERAVVTVYTFERANSAGNSGA